MGSKICYVCEKPITTKNEIGLTKKLLDKNAKLFYCFDCLANYLDVTVDELHAKVNEFKEQGCEMF